MILSMMHTPYHVLSNMAATKQKCTVCSGQTKYNCITCKEPICNICSIFDDDENPAWKAGKSVGYCLKCTKKNGLESETGLNEAITDKADFAKKLKKLKDALRSPDNRYVWTIVSILVSTTLVG